MQERIKKIKKDEMIVIAKKMTLRTEGSTIKVNETDKICGKTVKVTRVNKESLQISFLGENYRIPFNVNPSIEKIGASEEEDVENKPTTIAKNENKEKRQPISAGR